MSVTTVNLKPSSIGPLFCLKNPKTGQQIHVYGCFPGNNRYAERVLQTGSQISVLLEQATAIHFDMRFKRDDINVDNTEPTTKIASEINANPEQEQRFRALVRSFYDAEETIPELKDAVAPLHDNKFIPETSEINGRILHLLIYYCKAAILFFAQPSTDVYSSFQGKLYPQCPKGKATQLPLSHFYTSLIEQIADVESESLIFIQQIDALFQFFKNHSGKISEKFTSFSESWEQGNMEEIEKKLKSFPLFSFQKQRVAETAQAVLKLFDGKGKHFVFCTVDCFFGESGLLQTLKANGVEVKQVHFQSTSSTGGGAAPVAATS